MRALTEDEIWHDPWEEAAAEGAVRRWIEEKKHRSSTTLAARGGGGGARESMGRGVEIRSGSHSATDGHDSSCAVGVG